MKVCKHSVLYLICIASHILLHTAEQSRGPIYQPNIASPAKTQNRSRGSGQSFASYNTTQGQGHAKAYKSEKQESNLQWLWKKIKTTFNFNQARTRNYGLSQALLKEAQKNTANLYLAQEQAWYQLTNAIRAKDDVAERLNRSRKNTVDELYETHDPIERTRVYEQSIKRHREFEKDYDQQKKKLKAEIRKLNIISDAYYKSKQELDALLNK